MVALSFGLSYYYILLFVSSFVCFSCLPHFINHSHPFPLMWFPSSTPPPLFISFFTHTKITIFLKFQTTATNLRWCLLSKKPLLHQTFRPSPTGPKTAPPTPNHRAPPPTTLNPLSRSMTFTTILLRTTKQLLQHPDFLFFSNPCAPLPSKYSSSISHHTQTYLFFSSPLISSFFVYFFFPLFQYLK